MKHYLVSSITNNNRETETPKFENRLTLFLKPASMNTMTIDVAAYLTMKQDLDKLKKENEKLKADNKFLKADTKFLREEITGLRGVIEEEMSEKEDLDEEIEGLREKLDKGSEEHMKDIKKLNEFVQKNYVRKDTLVGQYFTE